MWMARGTGPLPTYRLCMALSQCTRNSRQDKTGLREANNTYFDMFLRQHSHRWLMRRLSCGPHGMFLSEGGVTWPGHHQGKLNKWNRYSVILWGFLHGERRSRNHATTASCLWDMNPGLQRSYLPRSLSRTTQNSRNGKTLWRQPMGQRLRSLSR